jgi:plastocyanin
MSEAPAGEITSYDWEIQYHDWSGGYYPSGEELTGSFEGVEEYDIKLTITDNGDATDSVTKTIDVGGDGPTADFDISSSNPAPNEEVVFDASDSETEAGDIVTYEWSYKNADGIGSSDSGESFTHSFSRYGKFTITLSVVDEFGRRDSIMKEINVSGEGPTADFTYSPSDPGLNERIIFDASASTEPDLTIESYRWFINGEPQDSESELEVVFDDAGVYVVELEVENTGGKVDRVREKVRVGSEAEIIDNPDFSLVRDSPEAKSIVASPGETISLVSEVESEEVPEATKFVYVDGKFVNKSDVDSKTLRTTYQFQEIGEHIIEIEVEGDAGKSDIVQWDVTAHGFNSLPSVTDQSSARTVDLDGSTEILTFSIKNPEVNNRAINTEMVVELPDGISISAASGFSEGSAAIQTSSVTIAPGNQRSVRLNINVDDESLEGQQLTIPYQIRYQPVGDDNITYTPAEQELKITVGGTQSNKNDQNTGGNSTENEAPGFDIVSVAISILLLGVGSKKFSTSN